MYFNSPNAILMFSTYCQMASKKAISIKEKLVIIDSIDKGEKQSSINQRLELAKSIVSTIWRNKDTLKRQFELFDFNQDCKRFCPANYKDVNAALLAWFKQTRNDSIAASGPLLLAKANSLAKVLGHDDFIATTGFIDCWKTTHSICMKKSVSEDVELWLRSTLRHLLKKYKPEDIYNADETGLFHKLQPDRTLAFKEDKCSGGKKSKDRLTF